MGVLVALHTQVLDVVRPVTISGLLIDRVGPRARVRCALVLLLEGAAMCDA